MSFENAIEVSNRMYFEKGLAAVSKRPTPVRVVSNKAGRITGFFEKPSTVDYDGTLPGGRSIVFEAKQSKKPRFDLSNMEQHQVDYLAKCHDLGAISFVLIELLTIRTVYLMPYQSFRYFWDKRKSGRGSASISLDDFAVHGWEVKTGKVPVDYLPVVQSLWGSEANDAI
jgi:recombination protein U